jgi:hypothetical protein
VTGEQFTHPGFTHRDGTQCIWVDGGWWVPLDAGGEGYPCEQEHPGDLSSGGRAKLLTEAGEPYAVPEEGVEDPGMLGLFATEFQVQWEGGAVSAHRHFDEARAAVRDNPYAVAKQIDRVETIWVRAREGAS